VILIFIKFFNEKKSSYLFASLKLNYSSSRENKINLALSTEIFFEIWDPFASLCYNS